MLLDTLGFQYVCIKLKGLAPLPRRRQSVPCF